jgi:hypothetical protein
MDDMQTYDGSCHCGAVQFSVQTQLSEAMQCNCSICAKAGWLLIFVPAPQFTLKKGEHAQTD